MSQGTVDQALLHHGSAGKIWDLKIAWMGIVPSVVMVWYISMVDERGILARSETGATVFAQVASCMSWRLVAWHETMVLTIGQHGIRPNAVAGGTSGSEPKQVPEWLMSSGD